MFETFEHTADLGLRVRAPDLAGLFVEAARGFLAVMIDNPEAVDSVIEKVVSVEGKPGQLENLLFDWLNELLFLFESERMLVGEVAIELGDAGLVAKVRGERYDPERHEAGHEVKAITYHGLKVVKEGGDDGGWLAEVIVDI